MKTIFCMTKLQSILFILSCLMFGTVLFKWQAMITLYKLTEDKNRSLKSPEMTPAKQQLKEFKGPPEFKNITIATKHEELAKMYHDYINKNQVKCNKIVRHGNVQDGGWDVCMDPPYALKKPCLVYSFGINNEWSFDDSISKKIGCEVHSFDPSMNVGDHIRAPTIHFHAIGLGDNDVNKVDHATWNMKTLTTIRKQLGHTNATIDMMKIDIEESEWVAFPEMFLRGSLNNVKQFSFEIHFLQSTPVRDPNPWRYHNGLLLFKNLYNLGYRIFKSHGNPYCIFTSKFGPKRYVCHEVYMIKVNS